MCPKCDHMIMGWSWGTRFTTDKSPLLQSSPTFPALGTNVGRGKRRFHVSSRQPHVCSSIGPDSRHAHLPLAQTVHVRTASPSARTRRNTPTCSPATSAVRFRIAHSPVVGHSPGGWGLILLAVKDPFQGCRNFKR